MRICSFLQCADRKCKYVFFRNHSLQKLAKSLVFDSWFDKIFWYLWFGKNILTFAPHSIFSLSEINLILDNHHTIFKLQINRMFHCLSSSLKTRPLLKTLDEKYEEATFAVLSYLLSQVCHPSLDHNKFRFSTGPGNRCWSELKPLKWLLGRL